MGLIEIDINDHPYKELTAEPATLNPEGIHRTAVHSALRVMVPCIRWNGRNHVD